MGDTTIALIEHNTRHMRQHNIMNQSHKMKLSRITKHEVNELIEINPKIFFFLFSFIRNFTLQFAFVNFAVKRESRTWYFMNFKTWAHVLVSINQLTSNFKHLLQSATAKWTNTSIRYFRFKIVWFTCLTISDVWSNSA